MTALLLYTATPISFDDRCRDDADRSLEIIDLAKSRKKIKREKKKFILCKNCRKIITTPDKKITIAGSHNHTFKNPAQINFTIGCFRSADGSMVLGEPTLEHTWFQGFSWSMAACMNCYIHLGWSFQKDQEQFFGLILNLLEEQA